MGIQGQVCDLEEGTHIIRLAVQFWTSASRIVRKRLFWFVYKLPGLWYFVIVAQMDKETSLSGSSIWNIIPLPHSVTQLKAIDSENKFDKLLVITVTYHFFLHSLIWPKCKVMENSNDSKNLHQWQLSHTLVGL